MNEVCFQLFVYGFIFSMKQWAYSEPERSDFIISPREARAQSANRAPGSGRQDVSQDRFFVATNAFSWISPVFPPLCFIQKNVLGDRQKIFLKKSYQFPKYARAYLRKGRYAPEKKKKKNNVWTFTTIFAVRYPSSS